MLEGCAHETKGQMHLCCLTRFHFRRAHRHRHLCSAGGFLIVVVVVIVVVIPTGSLALALSSVSLVPFFLLSLASYISVLEAHGHTTYYVARPLILNGVQHIEGRGDALAVVIAARHALQHFNQERLVPHQRRTGKQREHPHHR